MKNQALILERNDSKSSPTVNPSWRTATAEYQKPSLWRSLWQLTNTILPFGVILYLMYINLSSNLWLTLALVPLASGLQVRIFIFFHDCGHGAFFKSRMLNNMVGLICGLICLTPYEDWRHLHALHHATSGNLDRRAANQPQPVELKTYIEQGYGLLVLTISEYQQLNRVAQFLYRVYRHPLFLLVLMPPVQFLLFHRFPAAGGGKRERRSVIITNLVFLTVSLIMSFVVGFGAYVTVSLLIIIPTTIIGVWLFYIQHQFEQTYWKPRTEWSYEESALVGSSYYKLPTVLQWFSGNIGFHHIHHLSPRIPNYYLPKCQASYPPFEQANIITLRSGFKSLRLSLWDEDQQKMISFKGLNSANL